MFLSLCRRGYDSDRSDNVNREGRQSSHRRRSYSHSRSRSRSRDGRHGNRSSKHRRGDGSDYSDYDRHSDSERRSRYSSKRRRRDDYSDYSGSDYSDERYSRRHRDNYDSDPDNRSSERYSRRSRTDDDRSSRKHRRSSRSRSRSKESRDSGRKSRDKNKKKKRDKKERRHKKDRNSKDENGQPKVPRKVTVGRVGKFSSLRTLVNKKQEEGNESAGGNGDTPLDKAQAAIAESIDERRKQEKQEQERREENRRLETKIQQHVHGSRPQTSQQVQPTMTSVTSPLYSTYDLSQAQHFYPTAYPGYQYPYTAQNWTGSQWATSGSMVGGGDHAQYAQASGTGEQQYGSTSVSGSVEAGAAKKDHGQVSTAGTETGSGMGEQEGKDTDKTTAAPLQQPVPPPPAPQPQDQPTTPQQRAETVDESVKSTSTETADTSMNKDSVPTTALVLSGAETKQVTPDSISTSDVTVASSEGEQEPAVPTTKEGVVNKEGKIAAEEDASKKEDGDEITECEMEIDSGEGTPVDTPAHEGSPSGGVRANISQLGGAMTTDDVVENLASGDEVGEAQQQGTEINLVAKSEDTLSDLKTSSGARDQEPENSPEPLPPGVELEQKSAVTPPPQPQSAKVKESSLQVDKTVETEIDGVPMESDKPAQPAMESESTATSTQKQGTSHVHVCIVELVWTTEDTLMYTGHSN